MNKREARSQLEAAEREVAELTQVLDAAEAEEDDQLAAKHRRRLTAAVEQVDILKGILGEEHVGSADGSGEAEDEDEETPSGDGSETSDDGQDGDGAASEATSDGGPKPQRGRGRKAADAS